jgi:starch phosphorylase
MSEQSPVSKQTYSLLPTDIEGVDSLAELALDMRWSWNHATDEVWLQLDSALWEFTQNPWVVLQTVSRDKLQRVLAEPAFRKRVDDLVHVKRHSAETPAWFQQNHPQTPLTSVAYFSMEFMLSEALPIYSGGSAMWPAISSKRPVTWACRWSEWVCSTNKAIFGR